MVAAILLPHAQAVAATAEERILDFESRIEVHADGRRIALVFPPGWLVEHPLTRADLEQEREWLTAARYELELDG